MLTIEEQIERIADHALERASAPVRAPRRWPAMAAAAVVLLAAGSVVWAVTSRDENTGSAIAPGPASTPPGADAAFPLSDIESVVVEPMDDLRVQSSSGTIRVTFGDAPVLVGMPVVNDSGLLGKVLSVDGTIATVQLVTADGFSIGAVAEVDEIRRTGVVVGTGDLGQVSFRRVEDSESETEMPLGTLVVTAGGAQSISPEGVPIGRVLSPTDPSTRSTPIDPLWDDQPDSQMRVLLYIPSVNESSGVLTDETIDPLPEPVEPNEIHSTLDSNLVIDPPPPGEPFRTDVTSSESSLRIYTQDRPDPENGPWMMIGWSPDGTAGVPKTGDPTEPDRQFFDGGRGYVISRGVDPAEVRRLINGATVEPDGRRSIVPSELPDGLQLAFDGDRVSDVGRRARGGSASEVAWWADPVDGPFVRLLVADDPDMTGWRTGRVGNNSDDTTVIDTTVDGHPGYLRAGASVRVLSWHDGTRWLQLVASDTTDQDLLELATNVRQADPAEWAAIRLDDRDSPNGGSDQATVGPPGSDTTPILTPTTIGTLELQDGTLLSIAASSNGNLTLSNLDGFVIESIFAGAEDAVGRPMRITSDASPAAASGDLVYGIVVAGSTITARVDATGEEIPVALTDATQPVNGFIGFAARLPISTTYATMTITDPATGASIETRIGY